MRPRLGERIAPRECSYQLLFTGADTSVIRAAQRITSQLVLGDVSVDRRFRALSCYRPRRFVMTQRGITWALVGMARYGAAEAAHEVLA